MKQAPLFRVFGVIRDVAAFRAYVGMHVFALDIMGVFPDLFLPFRGDLMVFKVAAAERTAIGVVHVHTCSCGCI